MLQESGVDLGETLGDEVVVAPVHIGTSVVIDGKWFRVIDRLDCGVVRLRDSDGRFFRAGVRLVFELQEAKRQDAA